ncbi:hypothetical protein LDENG_00083830 [Lucifuga dentata]|nr:hypothetical protein LDENG_00083830 [Lucifuga dentata]
MEQHQGVGLYTRSVYTRVYMEALMAAVLHVTNDITITKYCLTVNKGRVTARLQVLDCIRLYGHK